MVSMHTDIIKRNTEPLKHSLTVPIVQVSVHHLSRHLIAISFLIKKWLGSLDYYCLSSSYHQLIVVEPPFVSAAGAETTTTTLSWWALAMVAYPEVQKRARAELETLLSGGYAYRRFPTLRIFHIYKQ